MIECGGRAVKPGAGAAQGDCTMGTIRSTHVANVDRQQQATTNRDEATRQEIGQAINTHYEQTKTDVATR